MRLQSTISLQLWRTWMIMGTSVEHRTLLERTSKFRPKRVSGFGNLSLKKRGLIRNV
jgi:hypothetical protein